MLLRREKCSQLDCRDSSSQILQMWVKFVKGVETHLPWEFWYSSSKKDSQENCTLVKCGGKKTALEFCYYCCCCFCFVVRLLTLTLVPTLTWWLIWGLAAENHQSHNGYCLGHPISPAPYILVSRVFLGAENGYLPGTFLCVKEMSFPYFLRLYQNCQSECLVPLF